MRAFEKHEDSFVRDTEKLLKMVESNNRELEQLTFKKVTPIHYEKQVYSHYCSFSFTRLKENEPKEKDAPRKWFRQMELSESSRPPIREAILISGVSCRAVETPKIASRVVRVGFADGVRDSIFARGAMRNVSSEMKSRFEIHRRYPAKVVVGGLIESRSFKRTLEIDFSMLRSFEVENIKLMDKPGVTN